MRHLLLLSLLLTACPGGTTISPDVDGGPPMTDAGNAECNEGTTRPCYEGPAASRNVGVCHDGTQTCSGGTWGACEGAIVPSEDVCGNSRDDNCDGAADEHCCPGYDAFSSLGTNVSVGTLAAGAGVTSGSC